MIGPLVVLVGILVAIATVLIVYLVALAAFIVLAIVAGPINELLRSLAGPLNVTQRAGHRADPLERVRGRRGCDAVRRSRG